MYGLWCNAFVFLTMVALKSVPGEANDKRADVLDTTFASLPINSKFWNPQLDDKTNMELIGIRHLDDSNKTVVEIPDENNKFQGKENVQKYRGGSFLARSENGGERYFAWGLLNLLKPMAWASGLPEASLRNRPTSKVPAA